MNGQIPLSGAGNTLCKLTFPPSRAGAARVSYDLPAESGISGAAKDKHKFPRSGPDFRKVSIGKWNAHREGAVDAKSNRFGQPRANVMQKTDLTRQPLLAYFEKVYGCFGWILCREVHRTLAFWTRKPNAQLSRKRMLFEK